MANKECLVIILDVRQNASIEHKRNSLQCMTDVLKEKICTGKKDFVSFVLLGTQRTYNLVNTNVCPEGYMNIVQYPKAVLPSWQVLVDFMRFVNEPSCNDGEWLDALVVAMEVIKNTEEEQKFQRSRILLFHDFDSPGMNYDMFDAIIMNLAKSEIKLIVVSNNIQYIDNAATGEPQAVFRALPTKKSYQLENEKYALRLVTNCSATLCNFAAATSTINYVINKRPWCWSNTLSIGTKITLKISGMIAIKNENQVKLKKCWGGVGEEARREIKSYIREKEVQPLPDDLIGGYMLGSTPIAFDDEVIDEPLQEPHEPGLTFLGFVKRDAIPEEYYTGDSLYWVVHQKGMTASAKKMDALVKALLQTEMAMLCWKVFSVKFNTPKAVVLLPNKLSDDRPASLSMIELAYHAQHIFWDFPTLRTKKNVCSAAQLDAIDQLIDAMDLNIDAKVAQEPRDTMQRDLLPFDTLPHVYEQYFLDMLERKVLNTVGAEDDYIQDLVAEKDYKELYWKLPEPIEQRAKSATKKVKEVFPLESRGVVKPKAEVKKEPSDGVANNNNNNTQQSSEDKEVANMPKRIGLLTPADDFEKLLKQHILRLDDKTQRDAKFQLYAKQMRDIIWQLLFDTKPLNATKVTDALKVLRKCSLDFNAFGEYNDWLRALKTQVCKQRLFDFWQNHITKYELGLCVIGELSLDEKLDLQQFYKIDTGALPDDLEMTDESVDALLASM